MVSFTFIFMYILGTVKGIYLSISTLRANGKKETKPDIYSV